MEQDARAILRALNDRGYQAYFVGGYVRDSRLGRKIKDIDLATDALPSEVRQIFPRTAPTGLKHGTVTVITERHTFEVTTFRTESSYEDGRRPSAVSFIRNLEDDLRRRDFTMNAMAMDADGCLIDPFGGTKDLYDGILRCVGDPADRFNEDALRMLRCVRFAAEYGLTVAADTWRAILRCRPGLRLISMERVGAELTRIMGGNAPKRGVELLLDSGMMPYFKDDLGHDAAKWRQAVQDPQCDRIALLGSEELRWCFWFVLTGEAPDRTRSMLRRLKFSNRKIARIVRLIEFHRVLLRELDNDPALSSKEARPEGWLPLWWKRAALRWGAALLTDWLQVMECLNGSPGSAAEEGRDDVAKLVRSGRAWLEEMPIQEVGQLAVGGTDLLSLRQPAGPWIAAILDDLTADVALRELPNRKPLLMERAKLYVKEMNRE